MSSCRSGVDKIIDFVSGHMVTFAFIVGGAFSLVATILKPQYWYAWIPLFPLYGYCILYALSPTVFLLHAVAIKKDECESVFQWVLYKIAFVAIVAAIIILVCANLCPSSSTTKLEPYPYEKVEDDDFRFGRPGH